MPAAARVVANEFIQLAKQDGRFVTPLELLKLVYIAHGYRLGYNGMPMIVEAVEAWRYGPVIPDLYRAMRHYGGSYVTEPLDVPFYNHGDREVDLESQSIIEWTYREYKQFDGIALSSKTHAAGTPWSITWGEMGQNAIIPPDLIANHYREKLRELAE